MFLRLYVLCCEVGGVAGVGWGHGPLASGDQRSVMQSEAAGAGLSCHVLHWAWQAVTSRRGHTSQALLPTSWQLAPLWVCCPPRTLSDPLLTESWCWAQSGVSVATHQSPLVSGSILGSLKSLRTLTLVSGHSVLVSSVPLLPASRARHGRGQTTPAPGPPWSAPGPDGVGGPGESSWPAHLSPVASLSLNSQASQKATTNHHKPGHKESTQYRRFFLES